VQNGIDILGSLKVRAMRQKVGVFIGLSFFLFHGDMGSSFQVFIVLIACFFACLPNRLNAEVNFTDECNVFGDVKFWDDANIAKKYNVKNIIRYSILGSTPNSHNKIICSVVSIGKLFKENVGNTMIDFLVCTSVLSDTPASIQNSGTADIFGVRVFNGCCFLCSENTLQCRVITEKEQKNQSITPVGHMPWGLLYTTQNTGTILALA
tara:strand:+ start:252 stop:875 length:624 start_codon:yes stop_codon:yes gene_type:complete